MKKKILSLLLISAIILSSGLASSCANYHPIDESQLPNLEERAGQTGQSEQAGQTEQTEQAEQSEQTGQTDQTEQTEQAEQADQSGQAPDKVSSVTEPLVSEEEALKIVINKVPGASEKDVVSFGRDYDDGRWTYEGELFYNGLEYDFEIDAQTGNILEWEIDN